MQLPLPSRLGILGALAFVVLLLHAEVLDRIAVTVDKQVIAESDVIRYLRVAAFLDGKPADLNGASKRAAAASLVDQALMMMEAADSHIALPSAEEAEPLLKEVKAQYANETAYADALKEHRITEQDVANHLLAGDRALRFADLRFGPEIQISDQDLQTAYDKFAADWRASHAEPPPSMDESRADLEKLLTGQRTTQLLDQWLETARMEKHVEYREAAFQ